MQLSGAPTGKAELYLQARAQVDVALLEALGQLGCHSEVVRHRLAAVLGAAEEHLQVAVVGAHVEQREDLRARARLELARAAARARRGRQREDNLVCVLAITRPPARAVATAVVLSAAVQATGRPS